MRERPEHKVMAAAIILAIIYVAAAMLLWKAVGG